MLDSKNHEKLFLVAGEDAFDFFPPKQILTEFISLLNNFTQQFDNKGI